MASYKILVDKHNTADFKDQDLEKKFLGLLLKKPAMFKNIIEDFNIDYFSSSRIRRIFNAIKNLYDKDGEMCNDISVIDTINAPEVKLEVYRVLWKKCVATAPKYFKSSKILAYKEQLRQLYDARFIEIGMNDALKILNQVLHGSVQKVDKVREILTYVSENTGKVGAICKTTDPVKNYNSWKRHYEEMQKNPKELMGVPTGIQPIDDVITGLRPSEFGLVITDTGVGKSIFLLDCAVNCWEKHGDVIYITIEMSEEQIQNRFWCNLSGIKNEKFRKLTLDKKDKLVLDEIAERKAKHKNKFIIVDMKEGCSVNEICVKLTPYLKRKGHNVKLICLDYLNIISDRTGDISLDWQSQVAIAMDVKRKIARKFNIPTWSGVQVTGDKIAFGNHIKDNIDVGVKIEETEDTADTDILGVSYPKTRDFKNKEHVIKTDRDRMTMFAPGAERKVEKMERMHGVKLKIGNK